MSRWYTFEEMCVQLGIPIKGFYSFRERGDETRVHKFGKCLQVFDITYCDGEKTNLLKNKAVRARTFLNKEKTKHVQLQESIRKFCKCDPIN